LTDSLNTLKDYCLPAPVTLQPASMNDIVAGLAPRWQAIAGAAGARVVLELADDLPLLPLHAGHLRILLLSLAENAACALATKPATAREIRVSTRAGREAQQLAVRDNGCGMGAERGGGGERLDAFLCEVPRPRRPGPGALREGHRRARRRLRGRQRAR
ncbi:MAG: hypothetical protein MUF02_09950, partial [Acidobacteria bacterium]|nr:hypothetical protein [Acidobacteriota bacterium]